MIYLEENLFNKYQILRIFYVILIIVVSTLLKTTTLKI